MEIPIEIFAIFMGMALTFLVIGLSKRIGVALLLSGMFIFGFAIMTDTIILSYSTISGNPDIMHYEVFSSAVSVTANIITPIRAEYPSSSSSQLIGDIIDCMSIDLAKTGNPIAGTVVRAGVWGATGNLIKQFGDDLDVQNMAAGLTPYEFCLPEGETYTIGTFPTVERFGFEYNSGDAANFVTGRTSNVNPYDGTVTFAQVLTNGPPVWTTPSTAQDMSMRMWLRGDFAETNPNTFEFTEMAKIMFALIGIFIMLIGVLYYRNE